jgi:flavodoxin
MPPLLGTMRMCVGILVMHLSHSHYHVLNFLQQYMDNYCDAAGELYDVFEAQGCKMFGLTDSTTGYEHQTSKADRAGKFVGLMCDEDNQYDLSEDRAKAWVAQLKEEGFF